MNLDWRNEKEYDYLSDLSFPQIAFEFLRRNPKFKKDFEEFSRIEDALESAYGPKHQNNNLWRKDGKLGIVYVPKREPGESDSAWLSKAMSSAEMPQRFWYEDWYRLKWGILSKGFPDPSSILIEPLEFDLTYSFPIMPDYEHIGEFFHGDGDEFGMYQPWSQRPGSALLVFDLESPLSAHLKSAKEILKQRLKLDKEQHGIQALSTYQRADFIAQSKKYLRILDADLQGEENEQIGIVLYGDDSEKEDIYYNAKILSDNRSRALLFRGLKYRAIPTYKLISD